MKTTIIWALLALFISAQDTWADGNITFTDIASEPASGLQFSRTPAGHFPVLQAVLQGSLSEPVSFNDLPNFPLKSYGITGIAILDFDADGDQDIYATNGPGSPNGLFSNQLVETGNLTFIDVGVAAGVDATSHDSLGTCYGDTDNDGDADLLVLGRAEANRFFINNGNGTYTENASTALAGGAFNSASCAMGDVNGDSLLDVVIANTYDLTHSLPILVEPFALNEPNQLFLNQGGNAFTDGSATSGILQLNGLSFADGTPLPDNPQGVTWGTAMVDIDMDGDIDILFADDQAAIPSVSQNGVDRGLIHVMLNDGTGHFTDRPGIFDSPLRAGAWMGFGFGDINCDGHIDISVTNFGDYNESVFNVPYTLGTSSSRVMTGHGDGSFTDAGDGVPGATPFGWGTSIVDYDNDGDHDVVYFGGIEHTLFVLADNPGAIVQNTGSCSRVWTHDAGVFGADYARNNVQGSAHGDLNNDGFIDFVTGSNLYVPETLKPLPAPQSHGSSFDTSALFFAMFEGDPDLPGENLVWNGISLEPGALTVEINNGGNGNGSVAFRAIGSIDLIDGGRVNRDGIGAVLTFTPDSGSSVTAPIQGGIEKSIAFKSPISTRHSPQGTVDGGRAVHNRLYRVRHENRYIAEIPCSFDGDWPSRSLSNPCGIRSINRSALAPSHRARCRRVS